MKGHGPENVGDKNHTVEDPTLRPSPFYWMSRVSDLGFQMLDKHIRHISEAIEDEDGEKNILDSWFGNNEKHEPGKLNPRLFMVGTPPRGLKEIRGRKKHARKLTKPKKGI